ncbi:hypothetical protein QWZ10_02505 [Paracoccus cavernae]|uniref:Uncharacterized protein n=1 Tax=Paracoccus cavernae TaxID=1571207 RepID=A0ABT8D3T7_9RHOB|nr:hypothetical protein [Paracoccus cavernae]
MTSPVWGAWGERSPAAVSAGRNSAPPMVKAVVISDLLWVGRASGGLTCP